MRISSADDIFLFTVWYEQQLCLWVAWRWLALGLGGILTIPLLLTPVIHRELHLEQTTAHNSPQPNSSVRSEDTTSKRGDAEPTVPAGGCSKTVCASCSRITDGIDPLCRRQEVAVCSPYDAASRWFWLASHSLCYPLL